MTASSLPGMHPRGSIGGKRYFSPAGMFAGALRKHARTTDQAAWLCVSTADRIRSGV